jgi:hypothetical protein
MWNAKASNGGDVLPAATIPDDWRPILIDIGQCYLPYLNANARAWQQGKQVFDIEIEGCRYRLPVHRYRVWCLERLQTLFRDAPEAAALLNETGCLTALQKTQSPASGFDPDGRAPFFALGRIWA